MRPHALKHCVGLGDGAIDFAATGIGRHARLDQFRQGPAGPADQAGNQQPGNHAAVTVGKIAKIVVRAHLSAIDRVFGAHALLDKRMAGLALHGPTPEARHDGLRVPGQARIVHHRGAGMVFQESLGEQADHIVALDKASAGIEKETAIEIAIPGDAEVGAVLAHRLYAGAAVLFEQGVGNAVGKVAVRLVAQLDKRKRQMRFEPIDNAPGAAVAGVDDDAQGLQSRHVNIAQQMFDIRRAGIQGADRSAPRRVAESATLGQVADIEQPGIA